MQFRVSRGNVCSNGQGWGKTRKKRGAFWFELEKKKGTMSKDGAFGEYVAKKESGAGRMEGYDDLGGDDEDEEDEEE